MLRRRLRQKLLQKQMESPTQQTAMHLVKYSKLSHVIDLLKQYGLNPTIDPMCESVEYDSGSLDAEFGSTFSQPTNQMDAFMMKMIVFKFVLDTVNASEQKVAMWIHKLEDDLKSRKWIEQDDKIVRTHDVAAYEQEWLRKAFYARHLALQAEKKEIEQLIEYIKHNNFE